MKCNIFSTVSFDLLAHDRQNQHELTKLSNTLREKLGGRSKKWHGRVVLEHAHDICMYNLTTKKIEFILENVTEQTAQLRDGSLFIISVDTIHLYTISGTLKQSCKHTSPLLDEEIFELHSGKILLCGGNSTVEYDRVSNCAKTLQNLENCGYVRVTQLRDSRLIFVSHLNDNLHVRDTDYNLMNLYQIQNGCTCVKN
jgi:hypothetical protein